MFLQKGNQRERKHLAVSLSGAAELGAVVDGVGGRDIADRDEQQQGDRRGEPREDDGTGRGDEDDARGRATPSRDGRSRRQGTRARSSSAGQGAARRSREGGAARRWKSRSRSVAAAQEGDWAGPAPFLFY
jgi:hypothetical protein